MKVIKSRTLPLNIKLWQVILVLSLAGGLLGCSTGLKTVGVQVQEPVSPASEDFAQQLELYRDGYARNPNNIELLVKIRKLEQSGEQYYYKELLDTEQRLGVREALVVVSNGLSIFPNSHILNKEKSRLEMSLALSDLTQKASDYIQQKKYQLAKDTLNKAIILDRDNPSLQSLLRKIDHEILLQKRRKYLVDLKFTELDVRDAIVFISKTYGVNVVFDSSVKSTEITMDIEDIPYVDAIDLLVSVSRNQYKVLSSSTLLIYADTKDRRQHYDDLSIKSFKLKTMQAKDMASLIKSVLGIKNITINESSNSIILKDSKKTLESAEQLILSNDTSPGEVVFDVEIMEINQTKAERLGIDYGTYQISTTTPAVPITGSIGSSIRDVTTLSIPSVSLNAFKQAVDARSLARPSIRVLDRAKAKIHIGDRVPLRKSSIQESTGQTRTTFEYQEIGIRFNVESQIHSSDLVTVVVALEVSSLGENLGTANEQAYRIGTRNATTTMLVRDGETAILAGLIRNEGRGTDSGIPGLSDAPYMGKLFGSTDRDGAKTDILLTLTPHIIRRGNSPGQQFSPGSLYETTHSSIQLSPKELDLLDLKIQKVAVAMEPGSQNNENDFVAVIERYESAGQSSEAKAPVVNNQGTERSPQVVFASDRFESSLNDTTTIVLNLTPLNSIKTAQLKISFNGNIAELHEQLLVSRTLSITDVVKSGNDSLIITVANNGSKEVQSESFMQLHFKARRKGTSFILADVENVETASGKSIKVVAGKSKLVVR